MNTAVMQPYFFPYIGYFQLMDAVDTFIFLDDVQYVERSWMNRNRILIGNKPHWLTFPVHKADRATSMQHRHYLLGERVDSAIRRVHAAYRSSPYFGEVAPVIETCLRHDDPRVASFNGHLLEVLGGKLGIRCRFGYASDIGNPHRSRGEERILDLCKSLETDRYINPIGGIGLYDATRFSAISVELKFLRTSCAPSEAMGEQMHPSIIDLLMRHGFEGVSDMLKERELLDTPPESLQ